MMSFHVPLFSSVFVQSSVASVSTTGAIDLVDDDVTGTKQADLDEGAVQLAAQVLHAIVVQHRGLVRAALRNMPPLPSLAVLKEVNAVLIEVQ
jgi:hypothetical protein